MAEKKSATEQPLKSCTSANPGVVNTNLGAGPATDSPPSTAFLIKRLVALESPDDFVDIHGVTSSAGSRMWMMRKSEKALAEYEGKHEFSTDPTRITFVDIWRGYMDTLVEYERDGAEAASEWAGANMFIARNARNSSPEILKDVKEAELRRLSASLTWSFSIEVAEKMAASLTTMIRLAMEDIEDLIKRAKNI